jgi:hypothetical protein
MDEKDALIRVPVVPDSGGASPTTWNRFLDFLRRCLAGHSTESVGKKAVANLDARLCRVIWDNKKLELEARKILAELDEKRQLREQRLQEAQIAKTEAEAAELQSRVLLNEAQARLNDAQAVKALQEAGLRLDLLPGDTLALRVRIVPPFQTHPNPSSSQLCSPSHPAPQPAPSEDQDESLPSSLPLRALDDT